MTLFLSDVRISFSPVKHGQNQAREDERDHEGYCSNHQDYDQDDRDGSHSRCYVPSYPLAPSTTDPIYAQDMLSTTSSKRSRQRE